MSKGGVVFTWVTLEWAFFAKQPVRHELETAVVLCLEVN